MKTSYRNYRNPIMNFLSIFGKYKDNYKEIKTFSFPFASQSHPNRINKIVNQFPKRIWRSSKRKCRNSSIKNSKTSNRSLWDPNVREVNLLLSELLSSSSIVIAIVQCRIPKRYFHSLRLMISLATKVMFPLFQDRLEIMGSSLVMKYRSMFSLRRARKTKK